MAGDAERNLRLGRSSLVAVAATGVVVAGITLALVTQNRALVAGEERLLAFALDAGKHGPEPPIVIDELGHEPSHGELASEINALVKAGASTVGVALPLDRPGISAESPDEQQLAVALQGFRRAAVMVRLEGGREVLPPVWLVRGLPAGLREADLPQKGPLARRLRVQLAKDTPQTLAAATFVAFRRSGPEIDEEAIGRLPSDRPRSVPVIRAGAQKPDVQGQVVLVCVRADDARPTAYALSALLRVRTPVHAVGADDAALVIVLAIAAGLAGFALRPQRAGIVAAGLAVLAFAAGFLISMQGRPMSTLAATLVVPLSAGPLALARATLRLAERSLLRHRLAQRTTRAVAIDLVAARDQLVPIRRRVCVLCADLVERVGTNVGVPVDVVRAVELHEQRVLDAVRHYGGIVDRLDGDRVVACFLLEGAGSPILAARAALEVVGASGSSGTAVGLDLGEALCGLFGVDRRYRVQGEVVRRAARAARVAAARGIGVACTENVCSQIDRRLATRAIGNDSELLMFEIAGDLRTGDAAQGGHSEELTIPR